MGLVFFPFKNYAALAVVIIRAPWESLRRGRGGTSRAGDEGSWRHLSDGTPYLTTGRTEFVEMAGSSLLSERGLTTQRLGSLRGFIVSVRDFLWFYCRSVTGVSLAVIKLVALLGYIHARVNLLTRDT